MIVKVDSFNVSGTAAVALRCPGCGREAVFEPIGSANDVGIAHPPPARYFGQRRCPSVQCHTHVFVVFDPQYKVLASYPAQRIDFDKGNVPPQVLRSFEEALTCHAHECYIGAAMLVRRTLEELCADQKAEGDSLAVRLKALKEKVVLPEPLFKALDHLRLLGNDAAHVEAKTYDNVGEAEVKVAITLTKEILKAVYQLDALVSQLAALKKP